MERRSFLASGFTALPAASARRVIGANERVTMGLIGCGGRGRYVASCIAAAPNTQFAGFADVYATNAALAKSALAKENPAETHADFRRLLERKEIDAVLVATPDHWHAIPTVLACQAGKDVYVEKPLAWSIREGQAMVKAAHDTQRLVMAGTQHRSATHFPEIAEIIQSGKLGEVRYVRVWNFFNMFPEGIGKHAETAPPEGLDWDFYLGPAPKVPFSKGRFLATYRWFYDYSGGIITDYGTHRFDTVHQIMGKDTPLSVSASGGRFSMKDDGDIPDVLQVTYEYPGFVMSYECTMLSAHGLGGRSPGMKYYNSRGDLDRPHGEAYYGTNGALFCDRIGYEIYPDKGRIERKTLNTTDATPLHGKHFVACLRGQEKPKAPIEVGHKSTIIPHIGNIAYRVGKKLKWDGAKERFDLAEANALLGRKARKPWDLI